MTMNSRLIQRARELQRTGCYADARAIMDAILLADPENEAAWRLRLEASETAADRAEALRALLRLHPDNTELWQQLVGLNTPETPVQSTRHQYRTLYLVTALLVMVIAGTALYFVSHNPLQNDINRLTAYNHDLTNAYSRLDQTYQSLTLKYHTLQSAHAQLQSDLGQLQAHYTQLDQQHRQLTSDYQTLQQQHNQLVADYQSLQQTYADLRAYSDQLNASYATFRNTAIAPPYIYIHGRQVTMAFVKIDGGIERWEVPFDRLENDLEQGHQVRANNNEQLDRLDLVNSTTQEHYSVVDFRKLIDGGTFSRVIPGLYYASGSDERFLQEAWNIVTQLTVYSKDIGETPRYPLETLLAGGGDCEDTAILLASMLKSAPVNWRLYLLYMDGDHPTAPLTVNHVVVYVDTGQKQYTIETTEHQNMLPYPSGVNGWYEEIP